MTRAIEFLTPVLALLALSFSAFAAEPKNSLDSRWNVTGVWSSEELGFELEIYGCGDARLCGRVVSYFGASDYTDVPKPGAQAVITGDQRIVGRELLSGFEADLKDGAKWNNGRIFNPKDGRTYKSTLTLADEDTLKLRAYVGVPIFGRNLTLRRMPRYSPAGGS